MGHTALGKGSERGAIFKTRDNCCAVLYPSEYKPLGQPPCAPVVLFPPPPGVLHLPWWRLILCYSLSALRTTPTILARPTGGKRALSQRKASHRPPEAGLRCPPMLPALMRAQFFCILSSENANSECDKKSRELPERSMRLPLTGCMPS